MHTLAVTLLVLAILIGWLLALVGLPGTWLMLGAAALYAWTGPPAGAVAIGWGAVAAVAGLALLGEALEAVLGMWGAKQAGGSRRARWSALAGSLPGAIAGAGAGIPVPVVGPVIGAVIGGALGALLGAGIAEATVGASGQHAWRVGQAAFWGRLFGSAAKAFVGSVAAAVLLVGLLF